VLIGTACVSALAAAAMGTSSPQRIAQHCWSSACSRSRRSASRRSLSGRQSAPAAARSWPSANGRYNPRDPGG